MRASRLYFVSLSIAFPRIAPIPRFEDQRMPVRSQRRLAAYAAFAALVCWLALSLQLYLSVGLSISNGSGALHGVWTYLAFFTVLTNLLAAAVITTPQIAPRSAVARYCARPDTLAGVSVNIVLVCVAYNLLLRNTWKPQGLWLFADILLHDAVPALFVVCAWLEVGSAAARFTARLRWATWPVAYFLYAMLRGAASGFYPYPFINAATLGYAVVLRNALAILAGYLVLAAILQLLDRLLRRRTASA
jgi:hypothetical protein